MTDVLEHKIMTKKRFNIAVEELVSKGQMSYLDAMSHIIESRGMDYSNIKKLSHMHHRHMRQNPLYQCL